MEDASQSAEIEATQVYNSQSDREQRDEHDIERCCECKQRCERLQCACAIAGPDQGVRPCSNCLPGTRGRCSVTEKEVVQPGGRSSSKTQRYSPTPRSPAAAASSAAPTPSKSPVKPARGAAAAKGVASAPARTHSAASPMDIDESADPKYWKARLDSAVGRQAKVTATKDREIGDLREQVLELTRRQAGQMPAAAEKSGSKAASKKLLVVTKAEQLARSTASKRKAAGLQDTNPIKKPASTSRGAQQSQPPRVNTPVSHCLVIGGLGLEIQWATPFVDAMAKFVDMAFEGVPGGAAAAGVLPILGGCATDAEEMLPTHAFRMRGFYPGQQDVAWKMVWSTAEAAATVLERFRAINNFIHNGASSSSGELASLPNGLRIRAFTEAVASTFSPASVTQHLLARAMMAVSRPRAAIPRTLPMRVHPAPSGSAVASSSALPPQPVVDQPRAPLPMMQQQAAPASYPPYTSMPPVPTPGPYGYFPSTFGVPQMPVYQPGFAMQPYPHPAAYYPQYPPPQPTFAPQPQPYYPFAPPTPFAHPAFAPLPQPDPSRQA